ncbi:helix-turn-helix domain-containing protein [Glutamicibacter sp.]|uniref:TetR/AcrR family transcriptional regulator n=1 Tax=Glutamicibacter sp. TaxID=1931995 RepID=UPI0028BDD4AE|nr:helix-turn-helix domain-containing protein [Glutamicibacter sp.]
MARPPAARTKVLDAYISLLCEEGERAATMEATAVRAGVSKGGLLYHFASKEALAGAVVALSEELILADLQDMNNAEEGASAYFIRTSAQVNTELDRLLLALQRLAQSGVESANAQLESISERWLAALMDEVGDKDIAHLIMLISEGLYAFTGMPGTWYQRNFEGNLSQLLELVPQLKKLGQRNQ